MFKRKLGIIDLSKNKVTITETPKDIVKQLLGGRGLNSYYLYKTYMQPTAPSRSRTQETIGEWTPQRYNNLLREN